MAKVIREFSDRSSMGKLIKILFILWNVICCIWIAFTPFRILSTTLEDLAEFGIGEAEYPAFVIGSFVGGFLTIVIWAIGFAVLGVACLATRNKVSVEFEE